MAKRKMISAELKAKIAIEALKEEMTARELAAKYEVSPVQVSQWKREFMERASSLFERPDGSKEAESAKEKEGLYKKIGELQMQVDFLKKKLGEAVDDRSGLVDSGEPLPVSAQCSLLGVSRSGYYARRSKPSDAPSADYALRVAIDK